MKKCLILVKHSLPEVQENIPAREWKLSEEGKWRAEHLADRLISYQPELLVSSVEPKAIETAEIISRKIHLQVEILENLHEHDRSKVSYLSKEIFEESARELFAKPDLLVFGNETANEAFERFSKAVHSILSAHKNKTIVIVSHGTVISLFVARRVGTSAFTLWNELGLPSFVVFDLQANTLITQENIV